MPTYSVAFSSQASTGIAKDLWYILSSSLSRFKISEVYLPDLTKPGLREWRVTTEVTDASS